MKFGTIWTNEKHSQEEAQPGRKSDVEKVRSEVERNGKSQTRQEMQVREKVSKSRNTVFFQCFVAPEGRNREPRGEDQRDGGYSVYILKENHGKNIGKTWFNGILWDLSSGNDSHSCGKSPFLMGKLT